MLFSLGIVAAVIWSGTQISTFGTPDSGPNAAPDTRVDVQDAPQSSNSTKKNILLRTTRMGLPVRWLCDTDIAVRLLGVSPPGAEQLVEDSVATISQLSGLRLSMSSNPLTTKNQTNNITIQYLSKLPGKHSPTAVGLGGVQWLPSGRITRGKIWIKSSSPTNTPGSPHARQVMLHELMHSIGIMHAPEDALEVMAPEIPPGPPLEPGPQDIAALKAAGCSR